MSDPQRGSSKDVPDYIGKMVRLLEARAKAVGVTREEYLDGMIRGKYPQIESREIDQFRETDGEAA
jgi:hypothetical protein